MSKSCYFCNILLNEDNEQQLDDTRLKLALDTKIEMQKFNANFHVCKACFQKRSQGLKFKNSLKKAEILSLKKLISSTFANKKSVTKFPFKVFYQLNEIDTPYPAQALFTVPKRSFKKAVDRNLLRRRIKEAYRKNKHHLYRVLEDKEIQLSLIIIYIAKQKMSYEEIEQQLTVSLEKIIQKIE